MRYDADCKIEIKTKQLSYLNIHRYVYYRILPSELPKWKRNFLFNPWRGLFRGLEYVGGTYDLFEIEDYKRLIFPLKTYGDVCKYIKEQEKIGHDAKLRNEAVKLMKILQGDEWPD